MHRILILASDNPLRAQLAESVLRTASTEVIVVDSEDELVSKLTLGKCAAVFADAELLGAGAARLIGAVRSVAVRPMLVIASNERAEDLDPELVTLIVRKPYDVQTLTGILLSAILQMPGGSDSASAAAAR